MGMALWWCGRGVDENTKNSAMHACDDAGDRCNRKMSDKTPRNVIKRSDLGFIGLLQLERVAALGWL